MLKNNSIILVFLTSLSLILNIQKAAAFDSSIQKETEKRAYIYIVGSSTLSPLLAAVSEQFSHSRTLKNIPTITPLVESNGTVEGFNLFCSGIGYDFPDFADASREMTADEISHCHKNGIRQIVEIKIGYDGIVFGNSIKAKTVQFTKEQLFLAVAEKIIDKKTKQLIKNPYQKWSEIDPSLPNSNIEIYGPPASSGTRELFIKMLAEEFCFENTDFITAIKNRKERDQQCHMIRSDGKFIDSGENDDLMIKNLENHPTAFGILGFNFLIANKNLIKASPINGIKPNFENISSKKYQLSRPLFVYFKREHFKLIPEMRDFIKELINEETIGKEGYLVHNGLVTLSNLEIKKVRAKTLPQIR